MELPGFIDKNEADYLLSLCWSQELAPSTTGRSQDLDEDVRTRCAWGGPSAGVVRANVLLTHATRSVGAVAALPPFVQPIRPLSARTPSNLLSVAATPPPPPPHQSASKTAWIPDSSDTLLSRLSERLSSITELPASHCEKWQAAAYDTGGRFELHTDHLTSFNTIPSGGRLCTLLIYLSEAVTSATEGGEGHHHTHVGGFTEFPALNVTIVPRRGHAIFFHNVRVDRGQVLTAENDAHGLEPCTEGG